MGYAELRECVEVVLTVLDGLDNKMSRSHTEGDITRPEYSNSQYFTIMEEYKAAAL